MIYSLNRLLLRCYRSPKQLSLQPTLKYYHNINNIGEIEFERLSVDKFVPLITNDDIKQKIEHILVEYERIKYTTLEVSSTLTLDDMRRLLRASNDVERRAMMNQLFWSEKKEIQMKIKRLDHSVHYFRDRNERWSKVDAKKYGIFDNCGQLLYGLWRNTLFTKILRSQVNRLRTNRLRHASLFGQKLVIDLGFDSRMSYVECEQTFRNIKLIHDRNKNRSEEVFDLHVCNVCKTGRTTQMIKELPNYGTDKFLWQLHTESYLDLFAQMRQNLVYLTPDSPQTLETFSHNDIYIIGGIEESHMRSTLTYAKALSEGIRAVKLPIDHHLLWRTGRKSLSLSRVYRILHDMKVCGDWKQTFRDNISEYNLKSDEQIVLEDANRIRKIKRDILNKRINIKIN